MKGPVLLLLVSLAAAQAQLQWVADAGKFVKEAAQGSWDMGRAYLHMREANYRGADKYFHARGNYDAARRGGGGEWASKVISDGRELIQVSLSSGRGAEDSKADQKANDHGRSGKDPNFYRPEGLPDEY